MGARYWKSLLVAASACLALATQASAQVRGMRRTIAATARVFSRASGTRATTIHTASRAAASIATAIAATSAATVVAIRIASSSVVASAPATATPSSAFVAVCVTIAGGATCAGVRARVLTARLARLPGTGVRPRIQRRVAEGPRRRPDRDRYDPAAMATTRTATTDTSAATDRRTPYKTTIAPAFDKDTRGLSQTRAAPPADNLIQFPAPDSRPTTPGSRLQVSKVWSSRNASGGAGRWLPGRCSVK